MKASVLTPVWVTQMIFSRPSMPLWARAWWSFSSTAVKGGVVRQSGVWVLGMDGRIAGSSDSAAQMLMLIRRAQRLHDEQGITVKLVHSDALREEAELEAATHGKSLADYQQQLEDEMAAAQPAAAPANA